MLNLDDGNLQDSPTQSCKSSNQVNRYSNTLQPNFNHHSQKLQTVIAIDYLFSNDKLFMMTTLEDIQSQVDKLAEKINAPGNLLPTYGRTDDGARPHVAIGSLGQLYLVVVERGEELQRELASNVDDLLYLIFDSVTFSMAQSIKVSLIKKHLDFRRHFFLEQEELLGKINPQWQIRRKTAHDHILLLHPFNDQLT